MSHDGNFHFVIITLRNRPPDPCVLGLNNSKIAIRNAVKRLECSDMLIRVSDRPLRLR